MALIDRVKWDGGSSVLAWKYPSQELSTLTQLIVNESQQAFLVRDGVYEGPFDAGRHTLTTNNLPLLRNLIGLPFGGQTPFSAEVWFVNRVINLDIRWGTPDPMQMQDPKFGVMLPVRAFGRYGIRIDDARAFLLRLVGTLPSFDAAVLADYFRAIFTSRIKTAIASAIVDSGVSILDVQTRLTELSDALKLALAGDLAEYGVVLSQFNIESINVPEADPAVQRLKAALARRAEMGIVGYDYRQERSFDVLHTAAGNQGGAGTLMSAGVGLAAAGSLAPAFARLGAQMAPAEAPPTAAGSSSPDHAARLALLTQLAELHAQHVLSDAEFETEKRRILAP